MHLTLYSSVFCSPLYNFLGKRHVLNPIPFLRAHDLSTNVRLFLLLRTKRQRPSLASSSSVHQPVTPLQEAQRLRRPVPRSPLRNCYSAADRLPRPVLAAHPPAAARRCLLHHGAPRQPTEGSAAEQSEAANDPVRLPCDVLAGHTDWNVWIEEFGQYLLYELDYPVFESDGAICSLLHWWVIR